MRQRGSSVLPGSNGTSTLGLHIPLTSSSYYLRREIRMKSLDLNANALTVLESRYLVKDDQGKPVEHPEDLFWRVARTIAAPDRAYGASDRAVESLAETFFELMATRVWMPNSPTLMNARSEERRVG